jgi:hypothetical protein
MFSLKIPFKTFHASADVAASPAPLARIREKMLEKGFNENILHKHLHSSVGDGRGSVRLRRSRKSLKDFQGNFSKFP